MPPCPLAMPAQRVLFMIRFQHGTVQSAETPSGPQLERLNLHWQSPQRLRGHNACWDSGFAGQLFLPTWPYYVWQINK